MDEIIVNAFNDMHVHLREFLVMPTFAELSAMWCENILAMPNLNEPLTTHQRINEYRKIAQCPDMNVLVAFYLLPTMTPADIQLLNDNGCTIAKAYPKNGTTNADHGINDYRALWPVFAKMEELGMTLCMHGEMPRAYVMTAEQDFLVGVWMPIRTAFPKLRMVLEHVTTAAGVQVIKECPRAPAGKPALSVATITAQHLCMTTNDVISGATGVQVLNACLPVAKDPYSQWSLLRAATGGDPRFFLGTDNAPHPTGDKFCKRARCGCFVGASTPMLLAQIFDEEQALDRLEGFTSTHARDFYGLPAPKRKIRLVRNEYVVPERYVINGLEYLLFKGGETLKWCAVQI